jgi:hypothetical protein
MNTSDSHSALFKEGILNQVEIDQLKSMGSDSEAESDDNKLLHEKERPAKAFFETHDGGMLSACGNYIYFLGIIDILTNYGAKKKMEYGSKRVFFGKTISCIPPHEYGTRFYNFMKDEVFKG